MAILSNLAPNKAELAKYLPLSGGTLTSSAIGLKSGLGSVSADANGINMTTRNVAGDNTNQRLLIAFNSSYRNSVSNCLVLRDKDNGVEKDYYLLHTSNKPSGTYTGNGDATSRTIDVGGIGRWLGIASANSVVFVNNLGGFGIDRSTKAITNFAQNELKYQNGVLTMATSSELVNFATRGYLYDVL